MKKNQLRVKDETLAKQYGELNDAVEEEVRQGETQLPPVVVSLVDTLRILNPKEKKDMRESIMAQIQDLALAQALIIMHTAKSDSVKLEAANSLLDRLNLPRASAQYSKSEATKVNHKDIITIMKGEPDAANKPDGKQSS